MAFPYGAAFAAFMAATATPGNPAATQPVQVQQTVPLIEPAVLKGLMASTRIVIVDVRRPEEYAAGHIDGAVLMPLDNLPATYAQLPHDVRLVVYCRSGHRSAQAVSFLLAHGYGRAVSLAGGYLAWAATK
ncbi:MAG TPA: rhodanese-like domain-containing protein [Rhizomicrobium sp.]|nr:rhodanese-like domain-containing protein [Rhizomicrobium sp.]